MINLLTEANSSTSTSSGSTDSGANFFSDLFNKIGAFFKDNGLELFIRIMLALLVIIIGHYLIKLIVLILRKSLSHERKNRKKLDRGIVTFTSSAIKFVLNIILVFIVFYILRIPLDSWASVISAAILAIGLSLQDTISNFSNGVFLLSSKNFQTGDYIEVDGHEGTVIEFNMMSIVLISPDKKKIIIPNSTVAKSIITNYSSEKLRRISLNFDVSYDSDIKKCRSVILKAVKENECVLEDPAPSVELKELSSSSLTLVLKCHVNNEDYWPTLYSLNEEVFNALKKNNINIPFNQLDVNLKTTAEPKKSSKKTEVKKWIK